MSEIRLLLLEDNADDALLIEESLRSYGLEIAVERTWHEEGLKELLATRQWDTVISDYSMPRIRAEEALAIVREHDVDLPFILVSGTVDPRVAVDMMRNGMHEFVLKDDLDRLPPALEREIRDAQHRRNEKIARAELFALQKQFRDTFEQSSVGIINLDRDMRVIRANQQAARMLGYELEELLGFGCDDLTWPEDIPAEQKRRALLFRGEANEYRAEKRYRRKDGTPVWALLTLTAIHDDAGKIAYFSAVIQDISEKKAAEERVVHSEQYVRAVLDSLPFQTAVIDGNGKIRMVNTAWENFAISNGLDDLWSIGIGASYFDVTPEEIRSRLQEVTSGERESLSFEYPCHAPDEDRWFLMKAAPLDSPEGGAVITHVDITSRVLAEHALERREQEYRAIVETMGEGLFTLDLENRVTYANRQLCEIVGYDVSEIVGQDIIELLAFPEDRKSIREISRRRLDGVSDLYESRMRHKSGAEILISMNAVPRLDPDGNVIGKLCVTRDTTKEKRAEREQHRLRTQIDEMNRIESLGKLAGTMAHEFNNVLMGIQPFADVIKRSVDESNTAVMNATRFIVDAVNRGRRVSQEVLRFARPTPPVRKCFGADSLLEDIGEIGRGILEGKNELVIESGTSNEISIDREQILQVFSNLTINARDASEPGGKIRISAVCHPAGTSYDFGVVEHPERFVHFTVADEGAGIPKEMLQTIFEPMVTTKRNGTGLGLAVTYQIVTSHGGIVFAESTEGQGTTLHIFLPIAETVSETTGAEMASAEA